MVNIRGAKESEKLCVGSPKAEVGEIDTRAPFQSVKAAVNLFGEVATPITIVKPLLKRRLSSENVIDKETQFMLAQRELNKLKQQLETAETDRSRALPDLERAKRTLQDLTTKLDAVTESKRTTIAAAEAVKELAKKLEAEMSQKAIGTEAWRRELEHTRKEYAKTVTELHSSKQALTEIRQDFDAALETKLAAFQRAGEAQRSTNAGTGKAGELSAELAGMKAKIERLKMEARRAMEERERIDKEKEAGLRAFEAAKQGMVEELERLRREVVSPEAARGLQAELAKAALDVEAVQEEMRRAHEMEMDGVRSVTRELDEATKRLQEVGEEESLLRKEVSGLKIELEILLKGKKGCEASDAQRFVVQRVWEEAESAKREEEEMRRNAEKVEEQRVSFRAAAEESARKVKAKEAEAKEAKERERSALEEMRALDSGKMRLSIEEFNSLTRKVETAQNSAELKEAESEAMVQGIKARKTEAERKLESNLKAIEEIKVATDLALRKAEMAESAKTVVESELRRWRQEEKKSGQLRS